VRSLQALGWDVSLVALSRRAVPDSWLGAPLHRAPLPALPRAALAALWALVSRRSCLNEALFTSRGVRRAVLRHTDGVELVVADGIRTAGPAAAAGVPWLLHVDDLLSDRYQDLITSGAGDPAALLGFFGNQLPGWLRSPAGRFARLLLGQESRLCGRRELHWARTATVTATTSPDEAAILAGRSGVKVHTLPMAVDVAAAVTHPSAAEARSAVFLGWLGYRPNVEALRWWIEEVAPLTAARLTVIGQVPDDVRDELTGPTVRFAGYVDDLAAEMAGHRCAVVPLQRGAGIKTKVLDAFAVGLPVVTTPCGVTGLDAVDGADLIVAATAAEFAAAVDRLADDAALADEIGARGRDLLARRFSSRQVAELWRRALPLAPRGP
jgi:glycosyltransferase involved in cell wall biosynthesis